MEWETRKTGKKLDSENQCKPIVYAFVRAKKNKDERMREEKQFMLNVLDEYSNLYIVSRTVISLSLSLVYKECVKREMEKMSKITSG